MRLPWVCQGQLTMEEIIFSLKHYWRFVDSETLDLKALSWGVDEKAAWTHTELRDRNSQILSLPDWKSTAYSMSTTPAISIQCLSFLNTCKSSFAIRAVFPHNKTSLLWGSPSHPYSPESFSPVVLWLAYRLLSDDFCHNITILGYCDVAISVILPAEWRATHN